MSIISLHPLRGAATLPSISVCYGLGCVTRQRHQDLASWKEFCSWILREYPGGGRLLPGQLLHLGDPHSPWEKPLSITNSP